MNNGLISFLRNLEVNEKLNCKTHLLEKNFKTYLSGVKISAEEKMELEKLFDNAIISAKEEFFELGILVKE